MRQRLLIICLICYSLQAIGQTNTLTGTKKKRLDFAKGYFELGGSYFPSFTGKKATNNTLNTFENSASFNPYLNWGSFHFWGHAEFYVTFPLNQWNLSPCEETDFKLTHSVATGARFLPWTFRENRIRPYVGVSWSALEFKQIIKPANNQPALYKDFLLVPEAGFLYGYKSFAVRLGVSYFHENKWNYPLDKNTFSTIETPKFSFQASLCYAFDASKNKDPKINQKWNSYPTVSKVGSGAPNFGDFFVGIGPSISFSLASSTYNRKTFPYLADRVASGSYFDVAIGYQFNRADLFTALSYRNPTYKNSGYTTEQTIQKKSLVLEVNKFLTDYTGFAPYIGVNMAYDQIKYSEKTEQGNQEITSQKFEPGITVGWDIVSGKTDDHFVLRTNLRWYPLSSFEASHQKFDFSQLEYNLIQLVFYPGRLLRKKKKLD